MNDPLYALTLWQPWADLIVDGIKPVENRDWRPPAWLIGKPFAIHAGLTYDRTCAEDCHRGVYGPAFEVKPKKEITLGAIVGIATLARVEFWGSPQATPNPWFFGPYGWWLRDVVKIEPVPCKGAMKLWRVQGETLEKVREAYRRAAP